MIDLQPGQCGLCAHFGENADSNQPQPLTLRLKGEELEKHISECDHPAHAPLHLMVTPSSGCAGFEPAQQLQA